MMHVGIILPAVVGDLLRLPDGPPTYLKPACDLVSTAPYADAYACLPCRQLLANAEQVNAHTTQGVHTLAKLCQAHGWEALR